MRSGRRWRCIVDNDFAGDPDGLVALAHLLLSESIEVVLVTASLLDAQLAAMAGAPAGRTASRGAQIARETYAAVGAPAPAIVSGAEAVGGPDEAGANPAAQAILDESRAVDDRPLLLLCAGPLTNVAAALRDDPTLAERARLIWVGGATGDGFEYNRDTDPGAAEYVLASPVDLVQIPRETYERPRISLAEVEDDLAATGALGAWLSARLLDVPPFVALHGALTWGDSVLVSVVALDPAFSPEIVPSRRVIADVDVRLLWGDLLSRLRRHEREREVAS